MEQADLVIVGAGWHGLAMAKTYLEANADSSPKVVVFDEAASVGGTWAEERLYQGLKTNNVVGSYEFSDFPMDPTRYGLKAGQHIPGAVVHRYLSDFTKRFGLDALIRGYTKVDVATLREDQTWLLDYSVSSPNDGSVVTDQITAKKLVVATGLTSEPHMPTLPGQANFEGHLFHAKELHSRSRDFGNSRSVVVIGGNKSAWDVCYSAAAAGAQAHMVMRPSGGGPSWVWRPLYFGFGSVKMTLSRLSSTRFFTWFDPNPFGSVWLAARHFLHRTLFGELITSIFWAWLDFCLESTIGYRDPRLRMLRPWTSTFWMGNSLSVHNYDTDWFELVRSGQVAVHHADVVSLDTRSIHLSNGKTLDADTIVCSTGWKCAPTIRFEPGWVAAEIGLPKGESSHEKTERHTPIQGSTVNSHFNHFGDSKTASWRDDSAFLSKTRQNLLSNCPKLGLPPIRITPGREKPWPRSRKVVHVDSSADASFSQTRQSPYRLYRFLVPSETPLLEMRNLAFIGAHRSIHAVVVAQAQALWITAYFQNKLPAFDSSRVRRDTGAHAEYQRLRRPKEAGGSGGRFPDLVFDSIPYIDLLLEDVGVPAIRKQTLWRNLFEPHTATDYRGLVPEWMSKSTVVSARSMLQ